ncbi:MAG: efflux RND transporter permease subunit [Candidatus Aminicenantes bacterium]|nr:efflux RND transporter permease subunit [Candidatus Aminicenantes bacterium]
MKIVEFSLRRRVTVSMVVAVIVIFGFIAFNNLGLDMLPDMETPYVSVITTYTGVSSEDIEESITRPLEQWVSTVSNVKELDSISQEGVSMIMVEFESGTNLDFAAQDVRDKIGLFENYLPDGADQPMVVKFNFADMPIMMYGITGGKRDLRDLKDYIDDEVATRLERLEGVASAIVFSSEELEVRVNVDKGKLESRGLSITQVERAVQASNINLPSGYIDERHGEFLIRTIGEFEKTSEIGNIVVGAGRRGEPIFLHDIATVAETNKEIRNLVRVQGTKGVHLIITKSSGGNTVLVARRVKDALEKIRPTLDPDLEFSVGMDFSRIIEIMTEKSANNILVGGVLAMLLIFLFLRNLRPTIAIGIAIPLSVVSTFIALYLSGFTLNLITLGGLALGVGMLVDNAVVVIENIFRHLEMGKTPFESARIGTSEVGTAIIASTLTTIAVFFPMALAKGMSGDMSRELAVAVAFSLLSSLFVALTIIPMLASWLFKTKKGDGKKVTDLGRKRFAGARKWYRARLEWALGHRRTVMISVLAIFVLSLVLAANLGGEFMPQSDRAMIFLKLRMPVGTNLAETDRVIRYLEKQSLKDPNVLSTMISVGMSAENAQDSASGFNPAGSYEATLWAYLKTSSQRDITDQQILEEWRRHFPEMEKGRIQAVDIASASMGQSSASPIEFAFFGRDLETLESIADRVADSIKKVKGIRDVETSLDERKPEIRLVLRKEELSRLGLTPYDISSQVRTMTIGTVVSRMHLKGEERDIRVRIREEDRATVEQLRRLPIMTPTGHKVYLGQVADFVRTTGAVRIDRENQVRKVSVTAGYVDRDLTSVVDDIMAAASPVTESMPEGYFYEMGGQYKEMMESFATMLLALLLAVVLVYAVMASQFESLKYPFIIMFTIPPAFIGVVVFLALTGKNVSLPAIMGFVMLAGIVVNNGIVMVDYINQLIRAGGSALGSIIEGAVVRLRPILITALSTMLGMLPMALATTEGAEMRSPMAIALIGGLLASTLLTLFLVPILYTYFSRVPKAEINTLRN